jgi:aldose 1-epimerase
MTTYPPQRSRAPVPTPVVGAGLPLPGRPRHDVHVLQNGTWRVGILPDTGGSLAFGQIEDDGAWVDLLRPTPADHYWSVDQCASFVMMPWSNRVSRARLTFGGRSYRLRVNADDGTAIHGTARDFPWEVAVSSSTALVVTFDSRDFCGVNYPWDFTATVTYQLRDRRFSITTELCNQHDEPIPAGFGHHPYFTRALGGPTDLALLELPFAQQFELEQALPLGPPVPVTTRVDFRELRPLGQEFVDDCLTDRTPGAPVRIVYPQSGRSVTLGSDDAFTHAVVYIPPDQPYFAVEPVTNANDAFSLHESGTPESGLVLVPPGEGLRASIWLDVDGGPTG